MRPKPLMPTRTVTAFRSSAECSSFGSKPYPVPAERSAARPYCRVAGLAGGSARDRFRPPTRRRLVGVFGAVALAELLGSVLRVVAERAEQLAGAHCGLLHLGRG